MKTDSRFLILFFTLILLPWTVFAINGPRIIRVLLPESVQIRRDGENIDGIKRGLELAVGDFVITGAGAKVFVTFPNGDSAVIGENTRISIEMYNFIEETETLRTRLKMDEGELIADLEKLKQNQYDPQFDVATKVGIAGIRGTQFIIRVRQDPVTGKIFANFGVTRGEVEVELTGAAALAARAVMNDVGAGNELIVSGDYDATTGDITTIDSINNVEITIETRTLVEQTVRDIVTVQQENETEETEQAEETKQTEETNQTEETEETEKPKQIRQIRHDQVIDPPVISPRIIDPPPKPPPPPPL